MTKFVLSMLLLFVSLSVARAGELKPIEGQTSQFSAPTDSLYWSKQWRDSVNAYHGRLAAYEHELVSYDLAFAFSFLPFAADLFVTKNIPKAAVFFFARTGGAAATLVGTLGLVRGTGSALTNVVLVILGVATYVFFKITEINSVQHDVSRINERLVDDFQIATPDIDSGSIRYPVRQWPAWVTQPPAPRQPRSAQDVTSGSADVKALSVGIQVPF
jgi:hypothetical protein